MKIIIGMLHSFLKTFRFIYNIQQDRISYRELIEFLHNETPPEDHNFLRYDYTPFITKVVRYGRGIESSPLFSIIIPTHNRRGLLTKTLQTIAHQRDISWKEFEVIIVDNGSRDRTEETVASFTKQQGLNVIFIKLCVNFGPDFARNIGVLHSKGNLLVFTDDDCLAPNDWLSWFKRILDENPKVIGASGWKEPYPFNGDLDLYHRFAFWMYRFYPPPLKNTSYSLYSGYTANFCCRQEDFKKIGGFNPYFQHIGFYDFPVRLYKLGLSLIYEPRMVKHIALFSFKDTFHKYLIMGMDLYLLHLLHPDVWRNISFFSSLEHTMREVHEILSSSKDPLLFKRTLLDTIGFSFLTIISNLCFWFGKYWVFTKIRHSASFDDHRAAF